MITKIEIDGFKTFRNFQMEFAPLTVVAGVNASGKSNLFDALQLLSRLAEADLRTAFSEQRGDAFELFTQYGDGSSAEKMSFAVDLLVNPDAKDNWGGEANLKYTRLRYELCIRRGENEQGMEELFVSHESLVNFRHNKDEWASRMLPSKTKEHWRPKVETGKRGKPYIKTEVVNDLVTIKLPQDGIRGGKETPANAIAQTVLSGVTSVDFPHVFAVREEMRSWKFLQLNPDVLREPTRQEIGMKDQITHSGGNLAAALHRITLTDPYALKEISRHLNNLLPNFTEVQVVDDKANRQFLIKVKNEDGREFTSRVLSEGTLRIMTLCIFLYDNRHRGLLCFEEPENGIHPARMKDIAQLLKDLSVDFGNTDSPLRQVIVNTHSPLLVGKVFELKKKGSSVSVLLSKLVTNISGEGGRRLKMLVSKLIPVEDQPQPELPFTEEERKLTVYELKDYLETSDAEKSIEHAES